MSRRNRRNTLLPRQREPSDLAYRAALLGVARRAQQTIRAELVALLRRRTDAADDSERNELQALFRRLRAKVEEPRATQLAKKFVLDGERANRKAMNEQYKQLVKIDVFHGNRALEGVMRRRASENIDLIKSIPAELLNDVERVVMPRVLAADRVETLITDVQERFSVSDNRAQLIARDQVGKFNSQLTRVRQEGLGVNGYTWSTSRDQRVRHDHAELEGRSFLYSDPPIVDVRTGRRANPGEDFQCRCQALASVSDVLDALGVSADEDVIVDLDV